MIRSRKVFAVCAAVLPLALLAAGCGGDDPGDRDPREVLEQTFGGDTAITSGVLDMAIEGSATGEEGGTFSASLSGPFEGEEDARTLPQLRLNGSITGEGGGDSVDEAAVVTITEDNAFVEYEGETYEAGAEMFESFQDELEAQAGVEEDASFREACEDMMQQLNGDPGACDIDVAGQWITNLENAGTEEMDGVEVIHVTGDLDVQRVLADVGALAQSIPGFNLEGLEPTQLAAAVPEASFDVYTGAEDEILRQMEGRIVIDPSAVTAGIAVVPVEQVELNFSLAFSAINEPQEIEAPAGPTTSLEELLGDIPFGMFGMPGGLGGAGAPDFDDDTAAPPDPGAGAPGGPEAGDMSPEQAQEYLDCIQEAAESGDPEAFNACAEDL